jgi:putative ATP-dependent endonuclease of the OLD family
MRVCKLELKNFRGIQQGSVVLPQHAVLLGANNVGKSTIVEALALVFGREKMVRPISDWDFFGGSPQSESRFYIIATITDFPSNDPEAVPDWFIGDKTGRPVWWNDETSTLSLEADPPLGTRLATQVALAARYDEETCDFDTVRYFYDGDADPFTDTCVVVPSRRLREIGLFLLSSNREWDKLLSFSSSSLLKVLREYDALPASAIQTLKQQLRTGVVNVEEADPLSNILQSAAKELQSFLLIGESSKIAYRPTSLDTASVLQSLVAHIQRPNDSLLPVARHGAGMVSLQAFLVLLAFAEQRKQSKSNFILAAEEPELHLQPSLHQRLVNRIRSTSAQSIVTTQSPYVADGYQPQEVVFVRNTNGQLDATRLRDKPIKAIRTNSVRKLYLVHRSAFYEALMGGIILVPEGLYDYEWLRLWQRIAQSSPDAMRSHDLRPITIVPTSDAAVLETFQEVAKFRRDALPILDGDSEGRNYLARLSSAAPYPVRVIRYGDDAAVEHLSAWILEPALTAPGDTLGKLLPDPNGRTLKNLQKIIVDKKKDRELRENLAWESLDCNGSCDRAGEFFHDLCKIAVGETPRNAGWKKEQEAQGRPSVFTASHIRKT